MTQIRIECRICDSQHDCTHTLAQLHAAGWKEIGCVRSYADAIRPANDEPDNSVLDWQTHLGLCPECFACFGSLRR